MELKQQMGPFCQSCGMPLERPDDFGTGIHGFRINDYCHYCFQGGAFTELKITMKEMIDKCVGIMARQEITPERQSRALMNEGIPRLKRWQ